MRSANYTIYTVPTASVPYDQQFNGDLGDWSSVSVSGTASWTADTYNGRTFAKIGSANNEAWLVSPKFTPNPPEGIKFLFETARNSYDPTNRLQVIYSTDYTGCGSPSSATWTSVDVLLPEAPADGYSDFVEGSFNVAGTAPIFIAFVYTSDASYTTWEVANVRAIEGNVTTLDENFNVNLCPANWDCGGWTIENEQANHTGASGTLTAPSLDLHAYTLTPTLTFKRTIAEGASLEVWCNDGINNYQLAAYPNSATNRASSITWEANAAHSNFTLYFVANGTVSIDDVKVEDVAATACPLILTVADGTATNSFVPVYGLYCDDPQRSQSIYPASMLTALTGKTITSLKYYVSSGGSSDSYSSWGDKMFTVSMAMTTQENLSSGWAWATNVATTVYTGTLTATQADGMTITLDNPFTYTGDNLLVCFQLDVDASGYSACTFLGIESTGGSRTIYYSSGNLTGEGTVRNFLPKVTFTDNCVPSCTVPTNLAATDITTDGATIQWDEVGTASYNLAYSADGGNNYTTIYGLTDNSYIFTGLDDAALYNIKVQADCSGGNVSNFSNVVSFETLRDCGSLTAAKVDVGTGTSETYYTPFYSSPYDSGAQGWSWQIFTREELYDLGMYAGDVYGVALQAADNGSFPIKVYMAHTDKTTFLDAADYISLETMTEVFDGTYTFSSTEAWSDIPFDVPFGYNGTQNIVVAFYRPAPQVSETCNFKYTSQNNTAIYRFGDIGATLETSDNSYIYYFRNNMRFDMCTQLPACIKPTLFSQAGDSRAYSVPLRAYSQSGVPQGVQVKFTADGAPINVDVTGMANSGDTIFFTLGGLQPDTSYTVWMRLQCTESDFSEWTNSSLFVSTLNDNTDISTMSISNPAGSQVGATVIDPVNHTVNMVLSQDYAAKIDSLVLNFGVFDDNSQVKVGDSIQVNGVTANDFTNPVVYTVLAEDRTITQDWTVTITVETCRAIIGNLAQVGYPLSRSAHVRFQCRSGQNQWNVLLKKAAAPYDTIGIYPLTATTNDLHLTFDSIVGDTMVYFTFNNLPASNEYVAYRFNVQNVCGVGDESVYYAFEYEIITCPTCLTPNDVDLSNIERRSATFSWTPQGEETSWEVLITDTMNWAITNWADSLIAGSCSSCWSLYSTTDTLYNFTNLDRNTNYYVYVRANCGIDDGYSQWTVVTPFKTKGLAVPDICTYVINMYDSYGDGWNGGSITVKEDGVQIAQASLASGNSLGSQTVVTNGNGINITFEFIRGSYPDEISFNIQQGGVTIYTAAVGHGLGDEVFLTEECGSINVPCPAVTSVSGILTDEGVTTGEFSWVMPADVDYPSGKVDVVIAPREITDFSQIPTNTGSQDDTLVYRGIEETSLSFDNLTAYTDYYCYVRYLCPEDPDQTSSVWEGGWMFKTNSVCRTPLALSVNVTSTFTADATWQNGSTTQYNNFDCLLYDVSDTTGATPVQNQIGLTETTVSFTGLSAGTDYWFYVRNNCGIEEGSSPYVGPVTFTTPATCPQPINLTVDDISAYAVTLNWERGAFGAETMWNVHYYKTTDSLATAQIVQVNDLNQYVVLGLTDNTEYACRVQAYCSDADQSEWTALTTFTTGPVPSACLIFADGTANNEYVPVYGYYCDAKQRSQSIYPASMLTALKEKTITSLKYFVYDGSSANWENKAFTVSMAMTTQADLSSAWATDATTTVYTGLLTANTTDGMTITLDAPFTYTGGNLLVSFELPEATGWTSCYFYGISSTGGSRYTYGDSYLTQDGTSQDFLPKVQFCVEPSGCAPVTNLTAVGITNNSAHVQWYPANTTDNEWRFSYADHAMDSAAAAAASTIQTLSSPSYDLTGLEVDVTYFVYVQTSCGEGVYTDWAEHQFTTRPLCSQPSVAVSDITDNSATLTCTNGLYGTSDSYSYEYWIMGSTDTISFDEAASVTLGGNNVAEDVPLQPMTLYGYRVKTNCTGSDGCSRWTEGTFKTACGAYLPFNEGFEADSWTLDCWTTIDADGDGKNWELVSSPSGIPHSGSQLMSSASYDNSTYSALTPDNWLISPAITITDNQQLSWWIGAQDPNYPQEHYAVYIISGTDFVDTTKIYETTLITGNYVQQVVKLRERAGETIKVAFRHFDCTDIYRINLDDVVIEDIPLCLAPFGIITNYVLSNSVNVSWQQGDIEEAWEYIVADSLLTVPASFDSYTPTPVSEREDVTISGLTAATEYWLYIRSNCGGTNGNSSWSAPLTFTTLCAQDTITVVSNIWSSVYCWQDQTLVAGENGFMESVSFSSFYNIEFVNDSATIGAKSRAISMPIWTKDSTNVQLSFRMAHTPNPAFTEKGVTIQYSYNTKDWVSIDTLTHHADREGYMDYVYKNAAFDNQENLFIGFLFENDGSADVTYINAPFVVEVAPDCAKPLNLFADNVTKNSADLHWNGDLGAATYNIAVLENSTTRPDTAILYHNVAATGTYNYTLTSLTGSTDYYVYVQAMCGGTDSSAWSNETMFTTECDTLVIDETNSFTEDFTGLTVSSFPPNCWMQERTAEGTGSHGTNYPEGAWTLNATNSYIEATLPIAELRDTKIDSKHNLVTPPLDLSTTNSNILSVKVFRNATDALYPTEGINLWISKTNDLVTDGNDAIDLGFISRNYTVASTINAAIIKAETDIGWYTYNLPISITESGVYYVIFEGRNQYGSSTYMDDVVVRILSTNTEITDYTAVTEQGTAITAIDAGNHEIDVQLRYGYVAGSDITPTITLGSTLSTIAPVSGTVIRWWNPSATVDTVVNYTVTAESGATQVWAVHFLTEACPSPIVTTADDVVSTTDNLVSLREAIAYAGTGELGNEITFDNTVFNATNNTLTLGEDIINIEKDLIITGITGINLNITASTVANINVNPGYKLTMNDISTDNKVNVNLKSNADGHAVLMHNSAVYGSMERYMTSTYWHFLSSPVVNQEINGDFTPSGSTYDFYCYDEEDYYWRNIKSDNFSSVNAYPTIESTPQQFKPGRGYLTAYEAAEGITNVTKTFAGMFNCGDITLDLSYSSTNTNLKGFNLVGNPYPSSIDWDAGSGWTYPPRQAHI